MVADHSDNVGMFPDLFAGKPEVISDPQAKTWCEMISPDSPLPGLVPISVTRLQGLPFPLPLSTS
ncbi:hypothetical protein N183_26555 [Sinorhizobium sp. Sb3]|nr:hypothetical protein N183_26555 [Sinorhizobium sp. Sb3]